MKIDHHLHTSRHSPDSVLDPEELIRRAREVGLDGVVITEHDYQWRADELAELAGRADGLVVLSGAEISAIEGHFLCYGLPHLGDVEPGIPLAELLKVVRGHGGAIVAAHPFRWGQDFDGIVAQHGATFDAVEFVSNNVSAETREQTTRLLGRTPMGATGSSDGHESEFVGCYYTRFDTPIASMADFVAGLRDRRTYRPGHRPESRLASGPVD